MTTVAYKDGVLATDSRITDAAGYIDSDRDKKLIEINGEYFAIIGEEDPALWIMQAVYFPKGEPSPEFGLDAGVIRWVPKTRKLEQVGGSLVPRHLDPDYQWAWGSGGLVAAVAMSMGATAEEAVYKAIEFDPGSGGRVWCSDDEE